MSKRIYLSPPHLTGEELQYLEDAIQSNWIAPVGPHVDAFEAELAGILKTNHVVTVNSGTSAIHLALLASGVSKGDEVVCATFTFCATANPVVYCGASPVFVDSEQQTWNMDPALLEEAIVDRIKKTGRKPKAILLVHLYGMPAQVAAIMKVSEKYEIPVIEDSAEALGSMYQSKQVGTSGLAGILSFNGNKIITTSGGGALISSDKALIEKARYLKQEAKEPLPYYEHKAIGYNYRLSNLLAAVGRSQLKVLQDRVKRRRAIFEFYRQNLQSIPFFGFQPELPHSYSNRWLTAVTIKHPEITGEKIRVSLEAANIESRRIWKPMHLQPVFATCPAYLNGTSEDLFTHGLCLPSGSGMTEEDMNRIVAAIWQQFAI